MTQKFTAEEVRANIAANRRHMTTETELQLTAYADTLSKPTDSGRVDEVSFSTVEKVVKALCRIGHTFPESQEEQAARFESLVLDLCRSVQSHFDRLTALAGQGQGDADELFNTFRLAYYGSNKSLAPELESFRRAYKAIAQPEQ